MSRKMFDSPLSAAPLRPPTHLLPFECIPPIAIPWRVSLADLDFALELNHFAAVWRQQGAEDPGLDLGLDSAHGTIRKASQKTVFRQRTQGCQRLRRIKGDVVGTRPWHGRLR